MFGQWFVYMVYPSGHEKKVSCALYDKAACEEWIKRWKDAGERFQNDKFRIVNEGDA